MARENDNCACDRVEEALTETDPLLNDGLRDPNNADHRQDQHSKIFFKIYIIVFFINLAFQILAPAQTQIYESIYCTQWYEQHPIAGLPVDGKIPESYCKIGPVQTQVSSLKGWLEFFNAAPGLLLSIPMGILTDAIGRRYLMISNITILCLTQVWITAVTWLNGRIPLRAIWLGSSLNLLSGGVVVTEMLFVCILTDISPGEKLANSFFRTTAFGYVSRVLGPLVAATLMRFDSWLAVYFGLVLLVITVILVATVPETLHLRVPIESEPAPSPEDQSVSSPREGPRGSAHSVCQIFKIWSDWRLVLVALTCPFRMIAYALSDLVQRYVSDRYGWSLADATLIYSLQAGAAAMMLFTVLPFISNQMDRRYSLSVIQKNVVMSRGSLFVLVVAYAVIGFAPTAALMIIGLLIETLSTGFPSTLRALAAALVDVDDKGRVFSVLAMAETFSAMMAYPVSATLFNIGIEKGGGPWLGLPYTVMSAAAAVGCVVMCIVRFERRLRM